MTQIFNQAAYDLGTKKAIVRNARKTFDSVVDTDGSIARFLAANSYKTFYGSLLTQLLNNGKLSEKQVDCVRSAIQKEAKEVDSFEAIVIECFTITRVIGGEYRIASSKPDEYALMHHYAASEKAAIAYCKRQIAKHNKQVALIKSIQG